MRVLFLDDDPDRHATFARNAAGCELVQVWTYAQLVDALAGPRFDQVFLDHDLYDFVGGVPAALGTQMPADAKTGLDAAVYVATLPEDRRPAAVYIHSWNPHGAWSMHQVLSGAGYHHIVRRPFDLGTRPLLGVP